MNHKGNMKFTKDLIWNYISIVIMAITGLVMNSVIAIFYGSVELGQFNETYAWYMILSQISVWGIHMAIVKFVPETTDEERRGSILWSALLIVVVVAILVTMVSEIVVHNIVVNMNWRIMMGIAFSGLTLMSINKVLLSYLNAILKMTAYAFFTSLRYLCLGILVFIFSASETDIEILAFVFPITEVIVFVFVLVYFLFIIHPKGKTNLSIWKDLIVFGFKILPSYLVLELNTKVDVVCLGFLVKDMGQIGVYSFAILFTEGFYMLYIVIRKIINPSLSEANTRGNIKEKTIEISKQLKKYLVPGGLVAYVAVALSYFVICLILHSVEYKEGLLYLLIICASMVFNGKSIVFGDMLAQIGLPSEESVLNIITVICNVIMNVILIMILGTVGAAIATALSYCLFTLYLRIRVKKRTGILL